MYSAEIKEKKIRVYEPFGSMHTTIGYLIDRETYKEIRECAEELGWEHDYEMQVTD